MKRIVLALAMLASSIGSAFAACSGPAVMHDFPGSSFNMSLATNAGDGNCASNMAIVGTLPAFASPPAVAQSGVWTPQGFKDSGGTDMTDTTNHALKVIGIGSAPSAAPTTFSPIGALTSGATGGLNQQVKQCDLSAFYDASTSGKTKIVTGVASRKIYICGYKIATGGTSTNIELGSGTGTNCGTTYTKLMLAWQLAANDKIGDNSAFWNGLVGANAADDWCVNTSAANAVQVEIRYTIQ